MSFLTHLKSCSLDNEVTPLYIEYVEAYPRLQHFPLVTFVLYDTKHGLTKTKETSDFDLSIPMGVSYESNRLYLVHILLPHFIWKNHLFFISLSQIIMNNHD